MAAAATMEEDAQRALYVTFLQQTSGNAMYTLFILHSVEFSAAVGQGVAFSGFLIGLFTFGNFVGGVAMWYVTRGVPSIWQSFPRLSRCVGQTAQIAGAVGLLLTGSGVGEVDDAVLQCILCGSRFLCGFGQGLAAHVNRMTLPHLTPASRRPEQFVRFQTANLIGFGLGPFLAVLASHLHGMPAYQATNLISLILASTVLVVVICLFPSLSDITDHMTHMDAKSELSAEEVVTKRNVILNCLLMCAVRAASTTGVESGVTYLLLSRHHWSQEETGNATSALMWFCIPAKMIFDCVNESMSSLLIVRILTAAAIGGVAIQYLEVPGSAMLLLLGGGILFHALYLADGAISGIAQQNLLPDGYSFDVNHASLWDMLFKNGIGGFLGPPLSRHIIQDFDQEGYVDLQLVLTCLFFLLLRLLIHLEAKSRSFQLADAESSCESSSESSSITK